jgi:hypothetical protein
MQNISIINQKINSVYSAHKFINKAKKQRLAFYYENLERVNNLDAQYINNYNFQNEVLNLSFQLEKLNYINKSLLKNISIERHAYAPELNKILIFNKEIKAPQITDISAAVLFLTNNFNIESLKQIKK